MGLDSHLSEHLLSICNSDEILAENVIQAYLSGILAHKCGSVAILSDNSTEFKNKVLSEACDQLGIKKVFL